MARFVFGNEATDLSVAPDAGLSGALKAAPNVTVSLYLAETGGTVLTDFETWDGAAWVAASSITTDVDGYLPKFRGPDTVTELWVTSGSVRRLLQCTDLLGQVEGRVAALEAASGPNSVDWNDLTNEPAFIAAGATAAAARAVIGAGTSSLQLGTTAGTAAAGDDSRLSNTRTPTDSSVTNAKVAPNAGIDQSKIAGLETDIDTLASGLSAAGPNQNRTVSGGVWSTRPTLPAGVPAIGWSTHDPAVITPPPSPQVGDVWKPSPLAVIPPANLTP